MIYNIIKEGQIVPSEVTVGLIQRAIESTDTDKFLIDGFPRCDENRIAFEKIVSLLLKYIILFSPLGMRLFGNFLHCHWLVLFWFSWSIHVCFS